MNSENECAEPIVAQILILEEIPCFAIFSPTYCMYGAIPRSDYSLAEPAEAPWHWLESEETEVSPGRYTPKVGLSWLRQSECRAEI
jgi:hypothetical protein